MVALRGTPASRAAQALAAQTAAAERDDAGTGGPRRLRRSSVGNTRHGFVPAAVETVAAFQATAKAKARALARAKAEEAARRKEKRLQGTLDGQVAARNRMRHEESHIMRNRPTWN